MDESLTLKDWRGRPIVAHMPSVSSEPVGRSLSATLVVCKVFVLGYRDRGDERHGLCLFVITVPYFRTKVGRWWGIHNGRA